MPSFANYILYSVDEVFGLSIKTVAPIELIKGR
jgi:hypothetical protein